MADHVIKELHKDAEGNVIPHLKSITLPNGNTYYLKDEDARSEIIDLHGRIDDIVAGGVTWIGYTTTALTDGATTTEITMTDGTKHTAKTGDLTGYKNTTTGESEEYIFDGSKWQGVGNNLGELKAFAYVDEGETKVKPEGSNADSEVTFADHTYDTVLGADSTFKAESSDVTFVTTGNTATVLTSSTTATVPKTVAAASKYIKADMKKLSTTTVPNVTGATTDSWKAAIDANDPENLVFSVATATITYGDDITAATGALEDGSQIAVGVSSSSTTSANAIAYIDDVTTNGTDAVTFSTGTTASVLKDTVTATAEAQAISIDSADSVNAITALGAGTAAAQTFTGTEKTYSVTPKK